MQILHIDFSLDAIGHNKRITNWSRNGKIHQLNQHRQNIAAMHRFTKVCIGYKLAFVSQCIISNIFASVKTIYLYTITSVWTIFLLF